MQNADIAMGKALSLTVVAEGVETVAQENFLREHGCDEMQGYYFSKPSTPKSLQLFLILMWQLHEDGCWTAARSGKQ